MRAVPKIKELRKMYGKISSNGFLNPMCDYLAFYPAKIFLYFPFTPNQITIIWIVIKIIMALLLVRGGYFLTVFALFIFQLVSILDGVDGIVARYTKIYSYNGIYLDYIGHYLCNSLLLIGLALGTFKSTGNLSVLLAAAIGVFAYLLSKSITINLMWFNNPLQRNEVDNIIYAPGFSLKSQKRGFLALTADFLLMDNPFNLMFWGVLFGYPAITLWAYAIFLTMELLRRMVLQYCRIKKYEQKKKDSIPSTTIHEF